MFTGHVFAKRLTSGIYKELLKANNETMCTPQKKICRWSISTCKVLTNISHSKIK